jgi:hypothetical protein
MALIHDKRNGLTKGLIFDLPFFERGGLTYRDIISKNVGSSSGSGIPTFSRGPYGYNALFDGTDDITTFTSNNSVNNLTQFSIELLIKINSPALTNDPCIFKKHTGGTGVAGTEYFGIRYSNASKYIYMETGFGTTCGQFGTGANSIDFNIWNHIVVTYNYNATTDVPLFYINGKSITTAVLISPSGAKDTDDTNMYLGNRSDALRPIQSNISYIRMWNRILTAGEVSDLYSNPWEIYRRWWTLPMF